MLPKHDIEGGLRTAWPRAGVFVRHHFMCDILSERSHIEHVLVPWDVKERQRGRFSFRPTKSAFSIFRVRK
jgi:hypothetical protein